MDTSSLAHGPQPDSALVVDAIRADAPSSDKEAGIRELLRVSGTLAHAGELSEAVVSQLARAVKAARPEHAERFVIIARQEAEQVFAANVPEFANSMVPIYHKYFTQAEVQAMIEFYASNLGQKTLQVMPLLFREAASVTEKWARALIPAIYKRARSRLRGEGIDF